MYTHVLFIRKSMRLEMILLNRIQVGESKFRQCYQEEKLDYVLWVPTCLNLNVLDTLLSNLIYCTSLGNPYSQKLKLFQRILFRSPSFNKWHKQVTTIQFTHYKLWGILQSQHPWSKNEPNEKLQEGRFVDKVLRIVLQ